VFDPNAQPMPGSATGSTRKAAHVLRGGVLHANGIALSPTAGRLPPDTRAGAIFVHDLDRSGSATARRTWAMSNGSPAGSRWTRGRR
jgi:hypothetical protein